MYGRKGSMTIGPVTVGPVDSWTYCQVQRNVCNNLHPKGQLPKHTHTACRELLNLFLCFNFPLSPSPTVHWFNCPQVQLSTGLTVTGPTVSGPSVQSSGGPGGIKVARKKWHANALYSFNGNARSIYSSSVVLLIDGNQRWLTVSRYLYGFRRA